MLDVGRAFLSWLAGYRCSRAHNSCDRPKDTKHDAHPDRMALIFAERRGVKAVPLTVCRILRQKGFKIGEAHCFAIARLCFNRIRALWRPGGYPPNKSTAATVPGER